MTAAVEVKEAVPDQDQGQHQDMPAHEVTSGDITTDGVCTTSMGALRLLEVRRSRARSIADRDVHVILAFPRATSRGPSRRKQSGRRVL